MTSYSLDNPQLRPNQPQMFGGNNRAPQGAPSAAVRVPPKPGAEVFGGNGGGNAPQVVYGNTQHQVYGGGNMQMSNEQMLANMGNQFRDGQRPQGDFQWGASRGEGSTPRAIVEYAQQQQQQEATGPTKEQIRIMLSNQALEWENVYVASFYYMQGMFYRDIGRAVESFPMLGAGGQCPARTQYLQAVRSIPESMQRVRVQSTYWFLARVYCYLDIAYREKEELPLTSLQRSVDYAIRTAMTLDFVQWLSLDPVGRCARQNMSYETTKMLEEVDDRVSEGMRVAADFGRKEHAYAKVTMNEPLPTQQFGGFQDLYMPPLQTFNGSQSTYTRSAQSPEEVAQEYRRLQDQLYNIHHGPNNPHQHTQQENIQIRQANNQYRRDDYIGPGTFGGEDDIPQTPVAHQNATEALVLRPMHQLGHQNEYTKPTYSATVQEPVERQLTVWEMNQLRLEKERQEQYAQQQPVHTTPTHHTPVMDEFDLSKMMPPLKRPEPVIEKPVSDVVKNPSKYVVKAPDCDGIWMMRREDYQELETIPDFPRMHPKCKLDGAGKYRVYFIINGDDNTPFTPEHHLISADVTAEEYENMFTNPAALLPRLDPMRKDYAGPTVKTMTFDDFGAAIDEVLENPVNEETHYTVMEIEERHAGSIAGPVLCGIENISKDIFTRNATAAVKVTVEVENDFTVLSKEYRKEITEVFPECFIETAEEATAGKSYIEVVSDIAKRAKDFGGDYNFVKWMNKKLTADLNDWFVNYCGYPVRVAPAALMVTDVLGDINDIVDAFKDSDPDMVKALTTPKATPLLRDLAVFTSVFSEESMKDFDIRDFENMNAFVNARMVTIPAYNKFDVYVIKELPELEQPTNGSAPAMNASFKPALLSLFIEDSSTFGQHDVPMTLLFVSSLNKRFRVGRSIHDSRVIFLREITKECNYIEMQYL